jgi:hypothetical protein
MYRFVVEHPRWIPTNRLAQLDVRAGAEMGRLYRVYPKGATLRPILDLAKLSLQELMLAFSTTNGAMRDLIHAETRQRNVSFAGMNRATNSRAVLIATPRSTSTNVFNDAFDASERFRLETGAARDSGSISGGVD